VSLNGLWEEKRLFLNLIANLQAEGIERLFCVLNTRRVRLYTSSKLSGEYE